MKVTKEKTESSQAFLTIEMEPAEVEESLAQAYQRLVKRANIPGFRKGKAPRAILERYVGREHLLEDALDSLIPQAYDKAIKEQGIEAVARPQIEITQTEPVVFKAIVPLKPNVKLGDYHRLQVAPSVVEEVTETQVDSVVEELRHQHASWEPVERPAAFGDLLVMDIEGTAEGKPLINQKGGQYRLRRDSALPVPGFAEQLVEMKRGEVKEFNLQLPADYPSSDVAGKEVSFKVKVSEIKQEVLPELNDQFASTVSPDFKALADLRQRIMADMKQNAEESARMKFEEQVIDAVVGAAEVEFPPTFVEAEINDLLNQRFRKGRPELETYLRSINKTEEAIREELRPLAISRITRSLVLGKVAEEEKIEVTDAEINTEIENMTKSTTQNKDEIKKILSTPQARESIKDRLLTRKTIQRVTEIAKGSAETETAKKEEEKK